MRFIRSGSFNNLEILVGTDSNFSFPTHYHDKVTLTLIFEGTEHSKFNSKRLDVMAGEITVLAPFIAHSNPYSDAERISFATFYVDFDLLTYFNKGRMLSFDFASMVDDYLFKLLQACVSLADRNKKWFEHFFSLAINRLVNKHLSNRDLIFEKNNRLFQELIAGISGNEFSLLSTARKMGIDQFKLIRIFKDETGMTPKQYFLYQKILKGKRLISTGVPISEVVMELDFYDHSHFYKQFKRFTGVTPHQYASVVLCNSVQEK